MQNNDLITYKELKPLANKYLKARLLLEEVHIVVAGRLQNYFGPDRYHNVKDLQFP